MTNLITLPNSTTFFISENKSFEQWLKAVKFHREIFVNNTAETWLLYCENSYDFSILFFGLLTAHKKIVLPQNGTINQLQTCVTHVQGFAGCSDIDFNNTVKLIPNGELSLNKILTIPKDLSITLFTSGSSGHPKEIYKEFSQLLTEVTELESCFGKNLKDSCVVSTVSHQHIYGLLFKLIWPIWFGRRVILQPYEYPEHLCHDIKKYRLRNVSIISSPAHYHRLIKDNVYIDITQHIQCMFSSGGPLSLEASIQLNDELGKSPFEIFGSTETGGIGWRQRTRKHQEQWKAFNGIELAEQQDTGCLKIKSPYITFTDWYLCDDKVDLLGGAYFKLCGRVDRIVKIEEKRVSLDYVQACLKKISFIDDAYCLTAINKRGVQVVAVIVLSESAKIDLQQSRNLVYNRKISTLLHQDLEAIAIPKRFRYLSSLPYNPSGKLNKKTMESFFE